MNNKKIIKQRILNLFFMAGIFSFLPLYAQENTPPLENKEDIDSDWDFWDMEVARDAIDIRDINKASDLKDSLQQFKKETNIPVFVDAKMDYKHFWPNILNVGGDSARQAYRQNNPGETCLNFSISYKPEIAGGEIAGYKLEVDSRLYNPPDKNIDTAKIERAMEKEIAATYENPTVKDSKNAVYAGLRAYKKVLKKDINYIQAITFIGSGQRNIYGYPEIVSQEEYFENNDYGGATNLSNGKMQAQILYQSPHYKMAVDNTNIKNYPTAYLAQSQVVYSAIIVTSEPEGPCSVKMELSHDEQTISKVVESKIEEGKIELRNVLSEYTLPGHIQLIKDFTIQWSIQAKGSVWRSVDQTHHKLYVLLPDYSENIQPFQLFLDFGLEQTQNVEISTKDAFITSLWKKFDITKNGGSLITSVVRSNVRLQYYDTPDEQVTNSNLLMQDGSGQCTAFQRLFSEALRAQGIENTKIKVTAKNSGEHMLVKNWHFSEQTEEYNYQDIAYTHQNIGISNDGELFICDQNGHYGHIWETAHVTEEDGVPAQGNPNPVAHFPNHRIVKVPGYGYFDPSYGLKYDENSLMDMQEKAIDGVVVKDKRFYGYNDNGKELFEYYFNQSKDKLFIKIDK